jgi:hypothetical protein
VIRIALPAVSTFVASEEQVIQYTD